MEVNLSEEELEEKIAFFENIGDEAFKKGLLSKGRCIFSRFRYSFAPSCFDGSLSFLNVVKDMIMLLTQFEPEQQELIDRLKADNYFEILQDKPAKAMLWQLALRWETVFLDLGNSEENKYFLRNTSTNPNFMEFIYSQHDFNHGKDIQHVSGYKNVITIFANFTKEEFYELMKEYDPDFERFFN